MPRASATSFRVLTFASVSITRYRHCKQCVSLRNETHSFISGFHHANFGFFSAVFKSSACVL